MSDFHVTASHQPFLPSYGGVASVPEAPVGSVERGMQGRFTTALDSLVIAAELSPANEALRLGAASVAEAGLHNSLVTGVVFGAATLAVEGAATFSTARLLANERANKATVKANEWIKKLFGREITGSIPPTLEMGIVALGGVSVAAALKQIEDPTRTYEQNKQRGLYHAAWLSAVMGAEGAVASYGIHNLDNSKSLGALAVLVGSGVALVRSLRRKQSGEIEPGIGSHYKQYEAMMERGAQGTQAEGYNKTDFTKAVNDSRTRFIETKDVQQWPVISPIENFTEYVPAYFERQYPGTNVYYLSLPGDDSVLQDESTAKRIADYIAEVADEQGMVVLDQLSGQGKIELVRSIMEAHYPEVGMAVDNFVDPNYGTETSTIHYAGRTTTLGRENETDVPPFSVDQIREAYDEMLRSGAFELNDENETVLVDPGLLDVAYSATDKTTIDRLWEIYQQRFDRLIENNPTRNAQTREEFESMARDPNTVIAAHKVGGEFAAFAMFVGDINACDWLRVSYYKEAFAGENILYFPGIASDESMKGSFHSRNIMELLTNVMGKVSQRTRVVWQCTNVSAEYIPRLVRLGINTSGVMKMDDPEELMRYTYHGLTFTDVAKSKR